MKPKINIGAMLLFNHFFVGEKKPVLDEDLQMEVMQREQVFIAPENWETYKKEFLKYRLNSWAAMEQYKSFTRKELAQNELDFVQSITPNNQVEKTMLKRYIELIKKQLKQPDTMPKALISYQWNGTPEELSELYTAMKDTYKLIDQSTTPEQFKAVFTGQSIIETFKPIKWTEQTVLLAYFINQLYEREKLKGFPYIWSIGEKCFEGYSRKNLEQNHQNYLGNNSRKPKRHKIIDDLF